MVAKRAKTLAVAMPIQANGGTTVSLKKTRFGPTHVGGYDVIFFVSEMILRVYGTNVAVVFGDEREQLINVELVSRVQRFVYGYVSSSETNGRYESYS